MDPPCSTAALVCTVGIAEGARRNPRGGVPRVRKARQAWRRQHHRWRRRSCAVHSSRGRVPRPLERRRRPPALVPVCVEQRRRSYGARLPSGQARAWTPVCGACAGERGGGAHTRDARHSCLRQHINVCVCRVRGQARRSPHALRVRSIERALH